MSDANGRHAMRPAPHASRNRGANTGSQFCERIYNASPRSATLRRPPPHTSPRRRGRVVESLDGRPGIGESPSLGPTLRPGPDPHPRPTPDRLCHQRHRNRPSSPRSTSRIARCSQPFVSHSTARFRPNHAILRTRRRATSDLSHTLLPSHAESFDRIGGISALPTPRSVVRGACQRGRSRRKSGIKPGFRQGPERHRRSQRSRARG